VIAAPTRGLLLCLALGVAGCTHAPGQPRVAGFEVEIPEPIRIPPGSAHASFRGGRQVAGVSLLEPFCELEIATVSDAGQMSSSGNFRVVSSRYTLLKDPITRVPALMAGFGCSDTLFQESVWRLRSDPGSNVRSLRCIAPYFDCRLGPPLTLPQSQQVIGPQMRIRAIAGAAS
jgi:hypothetical protein